MNEQRRIVVPQWGIPGTASILVGGQFGSEGKGLAAAWLARQVGDPHTTLATCNAGAQAGHTTISNGRRYVCYHLPTTAVEIGCPAYVNAGSIIDVEALFMELLDTGYPIDSLIIHPHAAVITPEDRETERGAATQKIASTQKGVGAAIAGKIMRRGRLAKDYYELKTHVTRLDLNSMLARRQNGVVVEVPQGLDLSLNHGPFYPYATSRDCWVGSALSDAGIHPGFCQEICMVVRTYPIRVGHLYNEHGELLGESGPFHDDSRELDWARDFPGIEPERTTVTKRIRRIASWSDRQYEGGLRLNRPTIVFLNFVNYLRSPEALMALVRGMTDIERRHGLHPRHVFGLGPAVEDVTNSLEAACVWLEAKHARV